MLNDLKMLWRRNFDGKVAFSSAMGAAGLGVVAFLAHKSKVKPLKQAADIATQRKSK
ncbi:hypothetical protein [Marinimicrobium agarilyticum]|uniref:hypothetical protein n=1 Tax=Marinimicrobium agarilyticum TaxID=306546 RepID=UPI00041C7E8E|nr:hypothetical protein [Marinimicrobium agarilyticum]